MYETTGYVNMVFRLDIPNQTFFWNGNISDEDFCEDHLDSL